VAARILIAGGGLAGVEAMLALRALAGGRARIELLAADPALVVPAMATRSAFDGSPPHALPLADLADAADAGVRRGRLAAVDAARHVALDDQGAEIPYDHLVVAVGARRVRSLGHGAVPFGGPGDVPAFWRLFDLIEAAALDGVATRLAFVVPPGPGWPLPAYELALWSAHGLRSAGARENVSLSLVTPEERPLGIFGRRVADRVEDELAEAGVELHTGCTVGRWAWGMLELIPARVLPVDRVVALPLLRGPAIAGLPHDRHGFIRADAQGRVGGAADVFVVGDAGPFPIKQGGIGCQQADLVASLIARELGAPVEPLAAPPTLRAILSTPAGRLFMRSEPAGGGDESEGAASTEELWRPAAKVAGRYLGAYLDGECGEVVDLPQRRSGSRAEPDALRITRSPSP